MTAEEIHIKKLKEIGYKDEPIKELVKQFHRQQKYLFAEEIHQEKLKLLGIGVVSTRFLFEWFDKQFETKKWETYADSKEEAEIKFKNRTYLMENSFDGKYKCYYINVC